MGQGQSLSLSLSAHHPGGVIVEQIEEDDELAEAVDEEGANRESLHRLLVPPEGDI